MKVTVSVTFNFDSRRIDLNVDPSQEEFAAIPSEDRALMADTLRRLADDFDRTG